MSRTTAEKLQIKPDTEILVVGTADQSQLLDPLPSGVTAHSDPARGSTQTAVFFVADRAALEASVVPALPGLAATRATWVAYPKGGRSDLNRDSLWARAEELGWTATANIAVDEVWSAVRLKPQP